MYSNDSFCHFCYSLVQATLAMPRGAYNFKMLFSFRTISKENVKWSCLLNAMWSLIWVSFYCYLVNEFLKIFVSEFLIWRHFPCVTNFFTSNPLNLVMLKNEQKSLIVYQWKRMVALTFDFFDIIIRIILCVYILESRNLVVVI